MLMTAHVTKEQVMETVVAEQVRIARNNIIQVLGNTDPVIAYAAIVSLAEDSRNEVGLSLPVCDSVVDVFRAQRAMAENKVREKLNACAGGN